jgi:hypothetical protein
MLDSRRSTVAIRPYEGVAPDNFGAQVSCPRARGILLQGNRFLAALDAISHHE